MENDEYSADKISITSIIYSEIDTGAALGGAD